WVSPRTLAAAWRGGRERVGAARRADHVRIAGGTAVCPLGGNVDRRTLVSYALSGLLALGVPASTHADLFDTARKAVRTDLGRVDTSGVTLHGGASLTSGLSPSSATLLRGQAQVGGPCGSFNFATSLTQAFDELPALF